MRSRVSRAGDGAAEDGLREFYGPGIDQLMREVTGSQTVKALTVTIFAEAFSALHGGAQQVTRDRRGDFETCLTHAASSGRVFGVWLRDKRRSLLLTQNQLAELAGVGRKNYWLAESGGKTSRRIAERLVGALRLSGPRALKVLDHFFPLPVVKPVTKYGKDEFGVWLRDKRRSLEWTQDELVRQADVDHKYLSLVELGRKPSRRVAMRLVAALGLSGPAALTVLDHFFPLPVVKPLTEYGKDEFGKWLRATRESLELSQDEMAALAVVFPSAVSRAELGRKLLRETAEGLIAAVGLSGQELQEVLDHFMPVPAVQALREHPEVFGGWLRGKRKKLNLRQQDVAKLPGVSPVHVGRVERGEVRPSTEVAERLVAAVGSTVEQARRDIMRVLVEQEYPDLAGCAVDLVGSVRAWRDGHFATSKQYPADREVADALDLSQAQVAFACGVIERVRLTVTVENEYSGRDPTADPVVEWAFSGGEVLEFVRTTVLVDLSVDEVETILDHVVFGGPLTVVAQRWGTDAASAADRITTATQRLRAAFGSPDSSQSGAGDLVAPPDNTDLVAVGPVKPWTGYDKDKFGEAPRDRRLSLGWTQRVLAQRAGLSPSYVSQVESGKNKGKPSRDTAEQLVSAALLPGESLQKVVDHFVPVPAVKPLLDAPGNAFGQWLRKRRKSLDLSQGDVAVRAGAEAGSVGRVERGERKPSTDRAERLIAVVGCTVEQARQAMMRRRFEEDYPNMAVRAVELVRRVYIEFDERSGTADADVAAVVRGVSLAEVEFARRLIEERRATNVAVFEGAFSDSEVMDFVRAVLADLSAEEIETILDHVAFGQWQPLTVVAERLGSDAATAGELVEMATQRLQAALGSSSSPYTGVAGAEASATAEVHQPSPGDNGSTPSGAGGHSDASAEGQARGYRGDVEDVAALLDELRSRADGIVRRAGGQIQETLHPDGSGLRVELTVSASASSSVEQRLESPAAGVGAGHYTAPTAWGEDLATLLGDAAWTLTAGSLGTTLTVELRSASSATPALGGSAVPAEPGTRTEAESASGHDPSPASAAVVAGRTAGPGADDDRTLALRVLPATDARGRIDVVEVFRSLKPDGSFQAIRGVGHVGGVLRWGDDGPVLELKVVEGEWNGEFDHEQLGELAGAPGADLGSLALERVHGVTVNCKLAYVIDHDDGSGFVMVEYWRPDVDDPVFATVIEMINAAFVERISADGPRAGSVTVRHVIDLANPIDPVDWDAQPSYGIDYTIDPDGRITVEKIRIQYLTSSVHYGSSVNVIPDAGQRPWSAVVAYHEVQATRGGDRAARAVVFDKYAPVVRAVLGQAESDDARIRAIIDRAVENFGSFEGGNVTDWFRRAAELMWLHTETKRFHLGEAGVAALRGLVASKGHDARVQLAGDARTVTVTLTVDDSVYPTVPGLTDAAAQAMELVEYQIRHTGAEREIRLTFPTPRATAGVDVIDFEQRWQRNVTNVQQVLRARGAGPELVGELTERTRLRARELLFSESRAGDNLWFSIVAHHVAGEHFHRIGERESTSAHGTGSNGADSDPGSTPASALQPVLRFGRPRPPGGLTCVDAVVKHERDVHGRELQSTQQGNDMQKVAATFKGRLLHVAVDEDRIAERWSGLTPKQRKDFGPLLAAAAQLGSEEDAQLPNRLVVVVDRVGAQQRHVIELSLDPDGRVWVDFDYGVVGPRLLENWLRSLDAESVQPVLHSWIRRDDALGDNPLIGEAWVLRLREDYKGSDEDGRAPPRLIALDEFATLENAVDDDPNPKPIAGPPGAGSSDDDEDPGVGADDSGDTGSSGGVAEPQDADSERPPTRPVAHDPSSAVGEPDSGEGGRGSTLLLLADEWSARIHRARRAGEPLPQSRGSATEQRSVSEQWLTATRWLGDYYRCALGRSSRPRPGNDVGEDASIADKSLSAGGYAEYFGRGAAGRRSLALRLLGGAPGQPATEEQRLANHRRGALVLDGERVYAVVNNLGELLTPTGAFDAARIGTGIADIHAVEYHPNGVCEPVHPVAALGPGTPLAALFGGVERDTALRMVRFTRRLDEACARLEAAHRDGQPLAVDAAAAEYRRLGQLSAAHTSAVVRLVSQAVQAWADTLGIDVSGIESLGDRIAEYRHGVPGGPWGGSNLSSLESAMAEYRQTVLDVRRAEIAMCGDAPSNPADEDPPEWPGGAPLGLAAAALNIHFKWDAVRFFRFDVWPKLHEELRRAGVGSVAWVSERIDGQDFRYLLVVTPAPYVPKIVRVDRAIGAVWVVPFNEVVVSDLSVILFQPVRPQADSPPPESRAPSAPASTADVAQLRDRRDTLALGVHVDPRGADSGTIGWRRAIWHEMRLVRSELVDLAELERQHWGLTDISERDRDEVAAPIAAAREHALAVGQALVELDEVVRHLDSAETELADFRDEVVSAEIIAQELGHRGGGEWLSPRVAHFPGGNGRPPALLIAAREGRHMRAIEVLAQVRPEWADALWRPGLTREYRTALDEQTGPASLPVDGVAAARMERHYQEMFVGTVQRALLAEYLERGYSNFDDWLGSIAAAQRHTEFAGPDLLRRVFWQWSGDGVLQPAERIVADAVLRKFSVPDGPNPAGAPSHGIRVGEIWIPVRLETVAEQVHVAPPVGYPDTADLIAQHFAGWSDKDPDRLLNRIREALRPSHQSQGPAHPTEPIVYGRLIVAGDRSQAGGPENFGRVDEFVTRVQLVEHLAQLDPDATMRVRESYPDGDREYGVGLRDDLPVVVDPETDGAQQYSTAMPSDLLTIRGVGVDGDGRPLQPTAEHVEWLRTRREELAGGLGLNTQDWSHAALEARQAEAKYEWRLVEALIPAPDDPTRAVRLAELYQRQARIGREIERLAELAAVADDHPIAAARFAVAADRGESRRHLADEVGLLGGEVLTDHVALVQGVDHRELLVVAAQPAEADNAAERDSWERPHLIDALRELAARYPEYRNVLWSGWHIRYQELIRGETGWADLRPLEGGVADKMERHIRHRYLEAARDRLMTEYMRRRDHVDEDNSWADNAILRRLLYDDRDGVVETVSTVLAGGPQWPANDPARLIYDVMTGPVPQPRGRRRARTRRRRTVGSFSDPIDAVGDGMSRRPERSQAAQLSTEDRSRLTPSELGDVGPELVAAHHAAEQCPASSDPPASDDDERQARLTQAADHLDEAASRQVIDEVMRLRSGGIRLGSGAVYYRAAMEMVLAARAGWHDQELDRLIAARPDLLSPRAAPRVRRLAVTVSVNRRFAGRRPHHRLAVSELSGQSAVQTEMLGDGVRRYSARRDGDRTEGDEGGTSGLSPDTGDADRARSRATGDGAQTGVSAELPSEEPVLHRYAAGENVVGVQIPQVPHPIIGPPEGEPAGLSLSLEHGDEAGVGVVRRQMIDWLGGLGWLGESQIQWMKLVVTELVTNAAIKHGEGPVQVTATAGHVSGQQMLRMTFVDASRGVPILADTGALTEATFEDIDEFDELSAQGGRGTRIMREALEDEDLHLAWGYTLEDAGTTVQKTVYVELFKTMLTDRVPMLAPDRGISRPWAGKMYAHVSAIRELALQHGWSPQDARRDCADALKAVSALRRANAGDRAHPAQIIVEVLDDESGRWLRVTVVDDDHDLPDLPDAERLERYQRVGVDLDPRGRRISFDTPRRGGGGADTDHARSPPGSDHTDDAPGSFPPARPRNGENDQTVTGAVENPDPEDTAAADPRQLTAGPASVAETGRPGAAAGEADKDPTSGPRKAAWFFDRAQNPAHTGEVSEPVGADATADSLGPELLMCWQVRVDPERPGAVGAVLAEQMRLLRHPREQINRAVGWVNREVWQRIRIQSVPRVTVGVLASGEPLLIFHGHPPLPDLAVTPAGGMAPNQEELPAGTPDRAAALRDFVESKLPPHWGWLRQAAGPADGRRRGS